MALPPRAGRSEYRRKLPRRFAVDQAGPTCLRENPKRIRKPRPLFHQATDARSPAFGDPRLAYLNAAFGIVSFIVDIIAVHIVLVATACHVRATQYGASCVEDRSVKPH